MSARADSDGSYWGDAEARKSRPEAWQTFKRLFFAYILPHWKLGIVAIVTMLAVAATQTGVVALIRPLLDEGFVEKSPATIRFYAFILIGFVVFQGVMFFVSNYLRVWIGRDLVKQLRRDLHNRLLVMPISVFDQFSSGRLVSKLTYETEQVTDALTKAVMAVVQDTARIVFLLGYMIYLAPLLTLIVATIFPLLAVIIGFVNKRFRKYSKRLHRAVGGVGSIAEESVHAHQILKAFGQAERERNRFERVNERNRRQSMKLLAVKHAVVPVTRLIAGIALAGVIYLATMDALLDTISVGTFASFAGAVMLLNPPLKSLITVNASIQRGLTAASSVCQVIDLPAESDTGRRSVDCAQGCIEMEGLGFSYDGHSQVLRGIDLRAEPGERVALVGPSGGGKSSLVALIPRFYEPVAGEIRLDGVPVQEYRLADLRRQISMVGQNVALFNATVAENIAFGASTEVSQEQVERAANAAYAREFIEQLPQGFDTYIGQDGVLLSGGQRQRIAIARALLKDAPVLILDEATSALDTESEANIQQALDRLMVGRTTLVIAHRLSTIENADQIIFMEDGMIKERGTHSELLQSNGRYSDLYRLQFEE